MSVVGIWMVGIRAREDEEMRGWVYCFFFLWSFQSGVSWALLLDAWGNGLDMIVEGVVKLYHYIPVFPTSLIQCNNIHVSSLEVVFFYQ